MPSLHYTTSPEKYVTRSWEHFQMSGQGPYFGQLIWFQKYHSEKVQSAIDRYANEIRRVARGHVTPHLKKQKSEYLVGDKLTYADLMFVTWAVHVENVAGARAEPQRVRRIYPALAGTADKPANGGKASGSSEQT